ncbi:MAG TPA: hypothetical protein PKC29_00605 [Thermodesulfobacteriota bacterium]|nr:hypothetical protein [Thermodesulfobacteriota bacterium]
MHKERIIKSVFHALLLLLFAGAAAVIPARPSPAGEKPLVQYDDTDIAPPMPDAGNPDPLFEDPDPGAEITDPFEDGLGPDDSEPGIAPPEDVTDDYPAAE